MKKSGLTLRKNPVAMTLISLVTLSDGWISISGHGAQASALGLAIGFLIPAAITFLLLWGVASSLNARKEGRSTSSRQRALI